MMESFRNFAPYETVPLSATGTSDSVAFALAPSAAERDVMVTNAGSVFAFVAFGKDSATATLPGTGGTTDATPVPPGASMIITKNRGAVSNNVCAAITAGGSTQLYFTAGRGN